jgi:hypothetical protein
MSKHLGDRLSSAELSRFGTCPVKCERVSNKITSLADYFSLLSSSIRTNDTFWFRGHCDASFSLTPSALRFSTINQRQAALALMGEFRRIADTKLPKTPNNDDDLAWSQIGQHNGLPTRLLDWTESAVTALYFACLRPQADGIVFLLNPVDLNRLSFPAKPTVLDPVTDGDLIRKYLRASPRGAKKGRLPIAVNPVWNSARLILQRGVFTVHGSVFSLDRAKITSLVGIPILREFKVKLRDELQRIGVDEMTLFPELEHACGHLKRRAGLAEVD